MTAHYIGGSRKVSGVEAAAHLYAAVSKGHSTVVTVTKRKSWTVVYVEDGKMRVVRK